MTGFILDFWIPGRCNLELGRGNRKSPSTSPDQCLESPLPLFLFDVFSKNLSISSDLSLLSRVAAYRWQESCKFFQPHRPALPHGPNLVLNALRHRFLSLLPPSPLSLSPPLPTMDFHLVPRGTDRNYTGFLTKTIVYSGTLVLFLACGFSTIEALPRAPRGSTRLPIYPLRTHRDNVAECFRVSS